MFPVANVDTPLLAPERWFWTDRNWFRRWPRHVTDEIYAVSGGAFAELPLEKQLNLFGLEVLDFEGLPVFDVRGRWHSKSGSHVSVEEYGLQCILEAGGKGIANPTDIWLMVKKQFEKIYGHWLGFDETNSRRYTPNSHYTLKAMEAVEAVLNRPEEVFNENSGYYLSLWNSGGATLNDFSRIRTYIEIVGKEHIRSRIRLMMETNWQLSGSPDVIVRSPSEKLKFYEVKSRDKLHGSQGLWLRNVARPLSLDVSIIRISAAKH
jgi:hypothetical protein